MPDSPAHSIQLKPGVLILLALLFNLTVAAQETTLFCPSTKGELVKHNHYWLSYSEPHEQSGWVYYELTAAEALGSFDRTDNFRIDPIVSTGSAPLDYYVGSGYDRGHLAPAGDMAFSEKAMSESFYMSNMSPQHPSFNRGTWKKLETLVRNWAIEDGNLYVVTGGVLSDELTSVPGTSLSIPDFYYKVVLDWDADELRSIAFLLPNAKCDGNLSNYVVSIDSLESLTGIEFFTALPDTVEALFESQTTGFWDFEADGAAIAVPLASGATTLCAGTTLKGKPCSRKTKNESGFCYQHLPGQSPTTENEATSPLASAIRCEATTQKGSQCKRKTNNPSGKCWQHED